MSKLWDHLLPLHQAVNGYGFSAALLYLSEENAEVIDSFTGSLQATAKIREESAKLQKLCDECVRDITNYQKLIDLKDAFSEVMMLAKLLSNCDAEKIPESSKKTPDFKVTFNGKEMFVELKALNMSDGVWKHKAIMEESFAGKITQEDVIRGGARIAITEQEVMPYLKSGSSYDGQSTSMVVETLNQKVEQNLKPDQFTAGVTGLLLDFSGQLLLHGRPSDNLEEHFAEPPDMVPQSGELWHLAFGKHGVPMMKCVGFAGEDNVDLPLQSEGILRKHSFIAGLIFHIDDEFWGAAIRRRDNIHFIQFMERLCKKVVTITSL